MPEAYGEIADDLRRRIRGGELPAGGRLPSVEELGREYGQGLPAVRRAVAELVSEGLVDERPGRGTYVRVARRRVRRSNERHQWEKDRAHASREVRKGTGATERDTGLAVGDLVFSARYRELAADEELAELFQVPVGTAMVERVYRTRYAKEPAPFDVTRSYLVREHVAANPELLDEANEPWPGGTHHQLLTVGIELDRVVERIVAARPPSRDEAKALGMSPGMAVIVLRKTCVDINERVVEASYVLLPGDRTELAFVTPLVRW